MSKLYDSLNVLTDGDFLIIIGKDFCIKEQMHLPVKSVTKYEDHIKAECGDNYVVDIRQTNDPNRVSVSEYRSGTLNQRWEINAQGEVTIIFIYGLFSSSEGETHRE